MPKSIAVAGKGGTGKTTIAALLIARLRELGRGPVLAVDADPDSNLGNLLGIEPQESIGDLREEVRREIASFPAGMSKAAYVEAGLHQLIEEAEGFDLVTMGRGEGSGCYCYLNTLIKKFSDDLAPSYAWMVMDNEAGLEHLSRRTSVDIDALIVVVNDNPISLASARKIQDITDDLASRIRSRFVVTNMIKKERMAVVQKRLSELELEYVADIPYDPAVEDCIYEGKPLLALEASPVLEVIDSILNRIGGVNGGS